LVGFLALDKTTGSTGLTSTSMSAETAADLAGDFDFARGLALVFSGFFSSTSELTFFLG